MNHKPKIPATELLGKFIIIDQSLRDFRGHHFEYDIAVAEAAASKGWRPMIVSHESFRRSLHPKGIKVYPIFRMAWDKYTGRGFRVAVGRLLKHLNPARYFYVARNSVVYLLVFTLRGRPGLIAFWERVKGDGRQVRWRCEAIKRLGPRIFESFKHVPFLRTLLSGVWTGCLSMFSLLSRRGLPEQSMLFARDLKKALVTVKADSKDTVFIHTSSVEELEGALLLLTVLKKSSLPTFHLLLRRDCYEDLTVHTHGLGLRACLKRFHASGLYPRHVRFYTDTDLLKAQYDKQSEIRFVTVPIPFRHELIDRHARDEGRAMTAARAKNIVYMGDARPEKGYQLLPDMVQALWPNYVEKGKVCFTFQSNFNVPGGEPGMFEARQRLQHFPSETVRLLTEPMPPAEYYRHLGEADVVIIPCLADRYAARSSGILAEALAAGKPVIVPANTWMAAQIDPSRGRTYKDLCGLPQAVTEILDDYDSFQRAARDYAAVWRQRHSPEAVVACLTEQLAEMRLAPEGRPVVQPAVLYIMDADAFINKTGSEQVAKNQLDYLRRCNYRVYGVLLMMDIMTVGFDARKGAVAVARNTEDLGFAGLWVLRYENRMSTFRSNIKTIRACKRNVYSLDRELNTRRGFPLPKTLREFIKNTPLDCVFVNYVPNIEIVKRLRVPKDVPVICEMHDIQAHQYAMYGKRDVDHEEFARECAMLDRCASVIATNQIEMRKLKPYVRHARVQYVPQIIRSEPCKYGAMAGCRDLAEVLSAGGSDLEFVDWSTADESGNTWQVRRLERRAKEIDTLFVSTNHAPNIQSFDWFFHQVFLPYLAEKHVNVVVAGNIHWRIPHNLHPQVFLAGRQDTLTVLYATARIVILPIRAGAGTSIKTLEAVAKNKPIVATSLAFRGIDYDPRRFPVFDDPKDFARQILNLLESAHRRAEVPRRLYRLLRPDKWQQQYDTTMNEAFRNAIGDKALSPASPARNASRRSRDLVEWTQDIGRFNRVMRDFAERVPPDQGLVAPIVSALSDHHSRKTFRELYQAFMVNRSAPILKTSWWIRDSLERNVKSPPSFDEFVSQLKALVPETEGRVRTEARLRHPPARPA
jgi:glycosyltransferase involved in cell wall biosynthesis